MKFWFFNRSRENALTNENPVNTPHRGLGARQGAATVLLPPPLPPPLPRADCIAAPPTAVALTPPRVARAEGALASRPVNLLGYLLTCPEAPLPGTQHDRPLSPGRPNRDLENWQRAVAEGGAGALEDEHLAICPYTQERLVRPVWCPNGNSISEAALAQALGTQTYALAARRVGNPALPPQMNYAAEDNTRLCVEQLRLNRPLMWALDQYDLRDAPLHSMVLADDGAGVRQALAELHNDIGALMHRANLRAGPEGATPLILAAKWGKLDAMAALLENPWVFAELTDAYDTTAVWHLADRGDLAGMEQLFAARGNNVDLHRPRRNVKSATAMFGDGVTPLTAAFLHAHCAAVELLHAHGAAGTPPRLSHALTPFSLTKVKGQHDDPNCHCCALLGLKPYLGEPA
jgi:hypothetical protein